MKFTHYDMGNLEKGKIVQVTLKGSAANVRLMDTTNFQNYRAGRKHRYYGGRVTRSPYKISVPHSGRWHITIDMAGLRGTTRSSVRVLPSALPPTRNVPLSSVPSLIRDPEEIIDTEGKVYDVFISHASDDKDEIVRPLAEALRSGGLSVWYDEFELRIGDSLRRKIDQGIVRSRFGIVVLSNSFLGKGWTEYELDGLVTRANAGEQNLLPIWHKISKKEVMAYSPSLADKLARNTATNTVEEIATEIVEFVTTTR